MNKAKTVIEMINIKEASIDLKSVAKAFILENPYPTDSVLHDYCDKLGISPHDLETAMYAILTDYIKVGKHKDLPVDKFDPKQIALGLAVEKEHTDNPDIAIEIAKDHLSEIPDYYSRLKDMEDKAKS